MSQDQMQYPDHYRLQLRFARTPHRCTCLMHPMCVGYVWVYMTLNSHRLRCAYALVLCQ